MFFQHSCFPIYLCSDCAPVYNTFDCLNAWWINRAWWPRLFTRQHWLRQCYYWHHVASIVSPGCRILVVLLFCGACHDPVLLMLVVQLRLFLSRSEAREISLFHFWSFFNGIIRPCFKRVVLFFFMILRISLFYSGLFFYMWAYLWSQFESFMGAFMHLLLMMK